MGIYNRDNINYSTMIDNMLKNRMDRAQKRSNNIQKQGEIWGGFVKDLGNLAGRAYTASQFGSEEERLVKELEDLKKQKEMMTQQYSDLQEQKEMMKQQYSDLHSAEMDGYHNVVKTAEELNFNPKEYVAIKAQRNYDRPGSAEEAWLAAHPGKTHDDYVAFTDYMNSVYSDLHSAEMDDYHNTVKTAEELKFNPKEYEMTIKAQRNYDRPGSAEEAWLAAHPGKTHDDYVAFTDYMNSVYGGV